MILNKLKLNNFRNYKLCEVEFHHGKNVLFGKNGQGKTNILESIYYLALTKSFRTQSDPNLILHKENFFRIEGELTNSRGPISTASIGFSATEGKRLILNGQKIQKFSEYIGSIPVVLLAPSDLEITQQGPAKRRRFLNVLLSQASQFYLNELIQYRRSLKQRNAVLQSSSTDMNLLKSWEDSLILSGTNIIQKRMEAIELLDSSVKKHYRHLSGGNDSTKILYQNSLRSGNLDELRIKYMKAFEESREKDKENGVTSVGPHRDDLLFLLNGKPLRVVGSQGEHKTFTIALRMAEFQFLQSRQDEPPILIFDDVFSELDAGRIINMIDTLSEIGQVFITTTSPDFFGKIDEWESSTSFYAIENGGLSSLGNKWHKQDQLTN